MSRVSAGGEATTGQSGQKMASFLVEDCGFNLGDSKSEVAQSTIVSILVSLSRV